MGKGKGSGWKNLARDDSHRHSLASRGIRTAQRIKILSRLNLRPPKNKKVAIIRNLRLNMLKKLYVAESGSFGSPESFNPFFGQFSEKDSHYVPGDIFYTVADKVMPESMKLHTYLREVKGDIDKDKLYKIIYSKDKEIQAEVRQLDEEIISFLARNQGFRYNFITDKKGNERLITYTTEFKNENPKFFKELIIKVKNG